jgi:hypothetical protein
LANLTVDFVTLVLFCVAIGYFLWNLSKGKVTTLRAFPAIDAISEGADRALETGKMVHYEPGAVCELSGQYATMLLASLDIMRHVVRECIRKGAKFQITTPPRGDVVPLIHAIVQEVAVSEGKPEAYVRDNIRYYATGEAMTTGVIGRFYREGVACHINIGCPGGYELNLMEHARYQGAMTIGGTPRWNIVYFFGMVSDYVLIGDEMYAAAAKVGENKFMIATLGASDWMKVGIIALTLVGTILTAVGLPFTAWLGL